MLNCIITSNITSNQSEISNIIQHELIAQDSILFARPVINFCLEHNKYLLVLDMNQEKIWKIDLINFEAVETLSIVEKINFLAGIASDGIYIYLFTENSLHQFDPIRGSIKAVINAQDRIKIRDISLSQHGEIFLSDDWNNQIMWINSLSKIQVFNTGEKSLLLPGALFFDDFSNRLWIINRAQAQLEAYFTNGVLARVIKLDNRKYDRLYVEQENIFLLDRNNGFIIHFKDNELRCYKIAAEKNILNFFVIADKILVLKTDGVYQYQIN